MAAPQLTWAQVIARRLARQGLAEPLRDTDPAGVVAAMCGAHAQVGNLTQVAAFAAGIEDTEEFAGDPVGHDGRF